MEQEKPKKLRNYAIVEGYLRENNLKYEITKTGKKYITGDVIVSVSQFNAVRVRVRAFETVGQQNEPNEKYKSLSDLLTGNVVSIASYLQTLPDGTEYDIENLDKTLWEGAAKNATKVWLSGSIEEYLTIVVDDKGNEKETSSFSIVANNGGLKKESAKRPFNPRATVELDGRILNIRDEQKRDETNELVETGRKVIDYLYVDYKGVGHKFKLIAPNAFVNPQKKELGTIADFIDGNYEKDQTAKFNLAVNTIVKRKESKGKVSGWGQVSEPVVVTEFVRELIIIGGRTEGGINEDEPDYITNETAVSAQTLRLTQGKDNGQRAAQKRNAPKGAPAKGFGAQTSSPLPAAPVSDPFGGDDGFPDF